MPFPLIPILIAGFAALGVAAIVLVFLHWKKIVDWFMGRQSLKEEDNEVIAFTIKEKLKSGEYSVVQGFFNKKTDEVLDGTKYEAEDICDELKDKKALTIYE